MNRHEPDDHPTAVEDLLCDLDPPDDTVARLVADSLAADLPRPRHFTPLARGLLLSLVAVALLLIPAIVLLRSPAPEPAPLRVQTAPAESSGFSLSNREGLLVLRSPTGQYLAVSGGSDE